MNTVIQTIKITVMKRFVILLLAATFLLGFTKKQTSSAKADFKNAAVVIYAGSDYSQPIYKLAKVKVSVELVSSADNKTRIVWEKDLTDQFSLGDCPSHPDAATKKISFKHSVGEKKWLVYKITYEYKDSKFTREVPVSLEQNVLPAFNLAI
ncbi:MAG: hypothetical protein JWN76_500 [Chitinophagaceae bacterium]|nr:hypothetical protein [Chitinophagaceae bacterium]